MFAMNSDLYLRRDGELAGLLLDEQLRLLDLPVA